MAYGMSKNQEEISIAIANEADDELKRVYKNIQATILKIVGTAAPVDANYNRLSFRIVSYMSGTDELAVGHVAKRTGANTDRLSPLTLGEYRTRARRNGIPTGEGTYTRVYCNIDGMSNKVVHWGGNVVSSSNSSQMTSRSANATKRIRRDKVSPDDKITVAVARQHEGPLKDPVMKLSEFLDWAPEEVEAALIGIVRSSPTAIDYANAGEGRLQALMVTLLMLVYWWANVQYDTINGLNLDANSQTE